MTKLVLRTQRPSKSTQTFPASHWKYIFKLLGLMIVANNRVTEEKVSEYQNVAIELATVIDPSVVMTKRMVFDWFFNHRQELEAIIESLEYDSELLAILNEIKSLPQKLDVVTAMMKVGIADGDYGRMEQMFIKKTILYWNIRRNLQDETPYIRVNSKRTKSTTY